jgi:hypothetical protein
MSHPSASESDYVERSGRMTVSTAVRACVSGRPIATSLRRSLLFATTTLCVLGSTSGALAAQASAATIVANEPCYVNATPFEGAPMTISGTGFTPGEQVTVSGGTALAFATVAADGTFTATSQAPILSTIDPDTQATAVTARDQDGVTATTTVLSANLAVSINPSNVRHADRTQVMFKFSGFTPGHAIYAYYLHDKKLAAKMNFGDAGGPCGTFQQKALMYPGGRPRYDQYTVAFESASHYSKAASPLVLDKLFFLVF